MIEKLNIDPTQSVATNHCIISKINELVDAVNKILAVQEQYATIYNEGIVPMLTPENKEPAENVLIKSLRMDKEFAEAECVRLQDELGRTKKALDYCIERFKSLENVLDEKAEASDIPDNPDLYAWAARIKPIWLELKEITGIDYTKGGNNE